MKKFIFRKSNITKKSIRINPKNGTYIGSSFRPNEKRFIQSVE